MSTALPMSPACVQSPRWSASLPTPPTEMALIKSLETPVAAPKLSSQSSSLVACLHRGPGWPPPLTGTPFPWTPRTFPDSQPLGRLICSLLFSSQASECHARADAGVFSLLHNPPTMAVSLEAVQKKKKIFFVFFLSLPLLYSTPPIHASFPLSPSISTPNYPAGVVYVEGGESD